MACLWYQLLYYTCLP